MSTLNTSTVKLEALYYIHIQRYKSRLERARSGLKGFNSYELIKLISFWEEVKAKGFNYDNLTPEAQIEVRDALMDEGK